MLRLKANLKEIEIVEQEEFISGTVGAVCEIEFNDCWLGYEKTVVFKRVSFTHETEPINVLVSDMTATVIIPPETLNGMGRFEIGVFGIKDHERFPTLYSEEIVIKAGTNTEGKPPAEYTPSEIDQLRLSKQDKLTAGDGITIDENNVISATGGGGTGGGTTDYEELDNLPKINGVELIGDKSLKELGIEIPNMDNYYTKTEIDTLVGDIETLLGGI